MLGVITVEELAQEIFRLTSVRCSSELEVNCYLYTSLATRDLVKRRAWNPGHNDDSSITFNLLCYFSIAPHQDGVAQYRGRTFNDTALRCWDCADANQLPPIASFMAGGIAGGTEAIITYPMEFAKTRVQLRAGKGAPSPRNPFAVVAHVARSEGVSALYTGCSTLIVGTIAKDGIRFLTFDSIKEAFKDKETGALSPLRGMLAGMSAGVVASIFAVTPYERIKTALIDDARNEKRFRGPLHAIKLLVQESGPLAVYRGFVTTTLKQAGATSVRLGSYNIIKEFERKRNIPQNGWTSFANGMVAGTVTVYLTQPFDTVKTRAQSARGEQTLQALKGILLDHGVRGLWRGSTMRLGRVVMAGGILFWTYEEVTKILRPIFKPMMKEES